jgi:AcrR family transcriptional regulator
MASQRRRGEELETALLDAAMAELAEVGFAKLTMESVAARARTGVAVLYRRWPRKDDLVLAAIQHYGRTHPVEIPDTGSLRGDLMALLRNVSDARHSVTALMSAVLSGLQTESDMTPSQTRERIMGNRPFWSDAILRRAHERGEIDLDKIPPAILAMPFELLRHDLLLTLKPLSQKRILEITDDLFLPLAAAYKRDR